MSLTGLLEVLRGDPALAEAVRAAGAGDRPALDLEVPPGARAAVLAALASDGAAPLVLAVTATAREAEDLAAALRSLLPPESVLEFPAWETLPHERLSPRSDTVGRRLATLRRLAHPEDDPAAPRPRVVVAPARSLLQPLVSGLGDLRPVALRAGEDAGLDEVVERLAAAAYARVDLVERRGEFAVRGGIVDVFPPTEEHPLRVEFWGDTVEEIRWFKVADQRSLEVAEGGLFAPPCRELLLDDGVRARAAALADEQTAYPELREVFAKLAEGIAVEGMESLAPVLLPHAMELLVDQLPAAAVVVVCDPERVRTRSHDLVATSAEFLAASWGAAAAGGSAPLDLGASAYRSLAEIRTRTVGGGRAWWTLTPFGSDAELADLDPEAFGGAEVLALDARAAEEYRGDTDRALADVGGLLRDGWRVVLVTEGHGPAQRLVERLGEAGVPARLEADLAAAPDPLVVHVATGSLEHGFTAPGVRLLVLTEADLVGQKSSTKDMRRLPSRRRNVVDPLQLKPGDHIVHEQHGVGRYVEMVQRTVAGATREYLVVEYAPSKRGHPGDLLYVPMDQLELVTRYVGGDAPTLHKMGGSDWGKTKSRARKAVKQIAAELIKLYSARMASPGHAFGPDTPWQRELEDAFAYVETPDQLACIDEVKADMERSVPMDRLICGDVGYGKTEIAVRAVFKAVQEGKQVAVLVPTTLLVQQHFSTFSERYAQFPVVRARRRRRGAALRGRAQGGAEGAAHPRRRARDVGDADPADAGDGGDRHPRDVGDRHAPRGAAPDPHVRRRVRPQADLRRDPPRAAARRAGLLRAQPGRDDREGRLADPRAGARGPGAHRARADGPGRP